MWFKKYTYIVIALNNKGFRCKGNCLEKQDFAALEIIIKGNNHVKVKSFSKHSNFVNAYFRKRFVVT